MPEEAARGKGRPRRERPDNFRGRLGERIEAARKAKGWTVDDLVAATDAGLDAKGKVTHLGRSTIIDIERAEGSPSIERVLILANALGLSGEQLLKKVSDWTNKPGT